MLEGCQWKSPPNAFHNLLGALSLEFRNAQSLYVDSLDHSNMNCSSIPAPLHAAAVDQSSARFFRVIYTSHLFCTI